jgi:hypothetical protein
MPLYKHQYIVATGTIYFKSGYILAPMQILSTRNIDPVTHDNSHAITVR